MEQDGRTVGRKDGHSLTGLISLVILPIIILAFAVQQRFEFHPAQMEAQSVYDPHLRGWYQRVTGPLPAAVLHQLVFEQGHWELFTKRVHDQTGLSWQNREVLREGDWIDVDERGEVSVEWVRQDLKRFY